MKKYKTIVMDPPWPIGNFPAWFRKERRSKRENEIGVNPTPYSTMTLPEISRLPIGDLAADGAHLYLWTTDAFLQAALELVKGWGFEKSATLVWCKKPMGKGMGGTYPSNVEFVLFCRKIENKGWQEFGAWLKGQRLATGMSTGAVCSAIGAHGKVNHGGMQSNWENGLAVPSLEQWGKLKATLCLGDEKDAEVERLQLQGGNGRADGRWWQWKRGKHSTKPEAFQDIVEQVSPGPFLELFARRQRDGWDSWGDECRKDVELLVA